MECSAAAGHLWFISFWGRTVGDSDHPHALIVGSPKTSGWPHWQWDDGLDRPLLRSRSSLQGKNAVFFINFLVSQQTQSGGVGWQCSPDLSIVKSLLFVWGERRWEKARRSVCSGRSATLTTITSKLGYKLWPFELFQVILALHT